MGNAGEDDDGGDIVGPPRPPPDSDEQEQQEEDEEEDPYRLPISNEVVLSGADRAVTCVDVEHTGSRVVVGSVDNMVRLYDFNGMRSDLRPFRWVAVAMVEDWSTLPALQL